MSGVQWILLAKYLSHVFAKNSRLSSVTWKFPSSNTPHASRVLLSAFESEAGLRGPCQVARGTASTGSCVLTCAALLPSSVLSLSGRAWCEAGTAWRLPAEALWAERVRAGRPRGPSLAFGPCQPRPRPSTGRPVQLACERRPLPAGVAALPDRRRVSTCLGSGTRRDRDTQRPAKHDVCTLSRLTAPCPGYTAQVSILV